MELELVSVEEDGYGIVRDGCCIGYVFPDAFRGWRPYSIWGSCLTCGRKAHMTAQSAAAFFEPRRTCRLLGLGVT